MMLGAGRLTKEDDIELGVGIEILKHVGDYVSVGDVIALAYVNEKGREMICDEVHKAYSYSSNECPKHQIILDKVE